MLFLLQTAIFILAKSVFISIFEVSKSIFRQILFSNFFNLNLFLILLLS